MKTTSSAGTDRSGSVPCVTNKAEPPAEVTGAFEPLPAHLSGDPRRMEVSVEPEARRIAHETRWSKLATKVTLMSQSDDETSQMLGEAVLRQMVKIEKEIPLATPAEGEPVAWMVEHRPKSIGGPWDYYSLMKDGGRAMALAQSEDSLVEHRATPLYTHPAQGEGARETRLREHLENALTWERRLNGAEQSIIQGHKSDAIKARVRVHEEMKSARAALATQPAAMEERGERVDEDIGFFLTHYFMPSYLEFKAGAEKTTEDEIIILAGEGALKEWTRDQASPEGVESEELRQPNYPPNAGID